MLLVQENHVQTRGNTSKKCRIQIWKEVEDATMEEGANLAKGATTKYSPMNTIFYYRQDAQTHEESLAEGGATMLNQADKTIPSRVRILW